MASLSRRQLARYTAQQIAAGDLSIVTELAAFIVEQKRERELELIVRDIEHELHLNGIVIADITTARPLDGVNQTSIEKVLKQLYGSTQVAIRSHVDASVIGGVKVDTAAGSFDSTVARKLTKLKTAKL